ncbi:MAG: reverse gyrase [Desulfurococcaceae archaeon]
MIYIATETRLSESKVDAASRMKTHGIYRYACLNCGGSTSDLRLLFKAPCETCLPEEKFREIVKKTDVRSLPRLERLKLYLDNLRKPGELRGLVKEELELVDFENFFEKATKGLKMWSAQRTWSRRLLRRESFSIIAPTGTGKTVFSLIASLYRALKARELGRKVYLAFPTAPLLLQAWRKLIKFAENLGLNVCSPENWGKECLRVICIHGRLSKKEREFYNEKIRSGEFDILLTTSAFMHRYSEFLPKNVYDLVIMDDVDAVLRSGRAIRRLLNILGLTDTDIEKGLELIKLRARLGSLPESEIEKARSQVEKLEEEIEEARKRIGDVALIVNSATGKPRGIYPKLFRVFLNFEAGAKPEAIRNIVDAYITSSPDKIVDTAVNIARKLRDGLLVFVPVDKGVEFAEYVASKLRENGLRAEAFHAKKQVDLIDKFAKGELDVLVGVATYYGIIVRGIDLPERVKYVVFVGVPRHKFSSKVETISPTDLLRMLVVIREVLEGREKEEVDVLIGRIARRLRTMSQGALAMLRIKLIEALQKETVVEETPLLRDLIRAFEIVREYLSKPEVLSKLSKLGDVGIVAENGELYILIPDVATYIQASGRCSRLYPGGITKGLSIIVVDDERLLNGLVKRLRWIFEGFNILNYSELNIEELINEIAREREQVRRILAGEIVPEKQLELVKTALLIVESPNKARTIANFFGKPSIRIIGDGVRVYEIALGNYILNIVATGGHIYDLVVDAEPVEARRRDTLYGVIIDNAGDKYLFEPVYTDLKKCSRGHQFTDESDTCPKCGARIGPSARKLSVIRALRKLASEVDLVLIGTDPDSEGEKIAWDVRVLLEPYADRILRVEFHEVTRRAIINAIFNPRDFSERLVEAQIVRRIEDRWLGFSLSGFVQRYVWPIYCLEYLYGKSKINENESESIQTCCRPNRNLSAGRVQTPVLGYIIDEYNKSKRLEYSKYIILVDLENGHSLEITLNYEDASKILELNAKGKPKVYPNAHVEIVEEYEVEENPPPPFTTDALLAEASRELGFSTTKTMDIAQDLFEMGLITYHRTDSTRISDVGIEVARQYLEAKYGPDKLKEVFKPRTWGLGGAHEAIRPTRPIDADHLSELIREGAIVVVGKITRDHIKLYDLIFRRFIASQMKAARILKNKLRIQLEWENKKHVVEKEVVSGIIEKGYMEFYENIRVELPGVSGKSVTLTGYTRDIRIYKYPLPRFHDVIKWMKDKGIGRPSTYAKIIQTLLDRKYVALSKTRKALVVQLRGIFVYDFLTRFFGNVVSEETTRELEKLMDKVENGEIDYQRVLSEIYRDVTQKILSKESMLLEYVKTQLLEIARNKSPGYVPVSKIDKCVEGLMS